MNAIFTVNVFQRERERERERKREREEEINHHLRYRNCDACSRQRRKLRAVVNHRILRVTLHLRMIEFVKTHNELGDIGIGHRYVTFANSI